MGQEIGSDNWVVLVQGLSRIAIIEKYNELEDPLPKMAYSHGWHVLLAVGRRPQVLQHGPLQRVACMFSQHGS